MGRHTLPTPRLRILRTNSPFRFIIDLNHKHNRQISTTRRGTLLRAGSKQRLCATCQDLGGGIVVALFQVAGGDDAELLVGFVVGACGDSVFVSLVFPPPPSPSVSSLFSSHGLIGWGRTFLVAGRLSCRFWTS